jgi:hypothetical protein
VKSPDFNTYSRPNGNCDIASAGACRHTRLISVSLSTVNAAGVPLNLALVEYSFQLRERQGT